MKPRFERIDALLAGWAARHAVALLRFSVGAVYLWFGVLKLFPGMSPAQELAARTIGVLSGGLLDARTSVLLLALFEIAIGVGLVWGRFLRVTIMLMLAQMAGTVTPLLFFPNETFTVFPIAPTLEGQYIIKNIVLVSAAILIGATVRGGGLVADGVATGGAQGRGS